MGQQNMSKTGITSQGRWIRDSRLPALALMLPPALLLFTTFVILPLIDAGYYSFFKWNGYGAPTEFVGFQNYVQVLNHSVFYQSLLNTLIILVISFVVQIPLALGLALLIYRKTPPTPFSECCSSFPSFSPKSHPA